MPKGANGDGSIYWVEARKRWTAAISLEGGKRKRFSDPDRDVVREWLRKTQHEQDQGLPITTGKKSVEEYFTWWLEEVARPSMRLNSWVRYEVNVRLHVVPWLGKLSLTKVTPKVLQEFYNRLDRPKAKDGLGLAPNTARLIRAIVHRAFEDAVTFEGLPRNPATGLRGTHRAKHAPDHLEVGEARAVLRAVAEHRLAALYVLAMTTGMREGELLGLKWQDISLAEDAQGASLIQVRRRIVRVRGVGFDEDVPKTEAGDRVIMLAPFAAAAVRHHRERQLQERTTAMTWDDRDLVFPNRVGRPIEAPNFRARVHYPLMAAAGLRKIKFHALRHSTASLLFAEGIEPKVIQALLGHSSISVTLDLYTHLGERASALVAAQMEALFSAN